MGQAMSLNIARKGYKVCAYNRTPRELPELSAAGITMASTPAALATESDVIVCMLTDAPAVDTVLFGPDGAAAQAQGKVVVDMSTVAPQHSRDLAAKLAARGVRFVDAPVSGSKIPAKEGTLVILAGGDKALVEELTPLLLAMGKKVVYCGANGQGVMMKMANNLLLGAMMEGMAEMISFGQAGGLDTQAMLDVVLSGPLSCPLYGMKKDMFLNGEFPPQFPLKHMTKDINFVVQTADAVKSAAPAARTLRDQFNKAVEAGLGEQDVAAIATSLGYKKP
jgi:3-hydroxyisobutyrate dehydrogenase-like beta-hydroxyacid dehydrogenase